MLPSTIRNDIRHALLTARLNSPDDIIDAIEGIGFAIVPKNDLAVLHHFLKAVGAIGNIHRETGAKAAEASKAAEEVL